MFVLLAAGVAIAEVPSEDRWIGNDNLAVGVHQDGSFINEDMELGILWDPDGTEGPIPLSGDMIRVGREWDVTIWSWETTSGDDDDRVQGGPHTDEWAEVEWRSKTDNETVMGLKGRLTDGPLEIGFSIAALKRADVIFYDLVFDAEEELAQLAVGKSFDPDQDSWFSESYDTVNDSEDNWAYGASAYDERAIALAGVSSAAAEVTGGVCRWCDSPDEMLDSAGNSNVNDRHPNVLVQLEEPPPEEPIHVRFVYAFSIGGDEAKNVAIEMLELTDLDEDGLSPEEGDCDDWNPDTYPDATELDDGLDNDCDGEVDEDSLTSDDDGDGYSEVDGDCDDENPDVFPGATPSEGVTNADCDGLSDWPDGVDPGEETEPEDTGTSGTDDDGADDSDGADDGDAEDTGAIDNESPETEAPGSETGSDLDGFETDDGGIVIAGTKQGCSCSTAPRSTPWSWTLLLLACALRRKENP